MSDEDDAVDGLIGRVIGDAYVIQDLLGVGGMGRVYRAEQRALGRVVAVKVVHNHLLGDKETVSRFYTEARAASSLNHPNSVSVFDFGRTGDGMLYLVMEYLRGKDLAQVMHAEAPLPITRIVDIALGVLGALGEAHARGVVHRDLKPENVIVERLRSGGDLVKVVDFGLAQIRGVEPSEAARGLVAGTPDYMAPEQARAMDVDGRGDLYSLGIVLFELLAGRLPFLSDSPAKMMLSHVVDPVPNPQELAPYRGIPDALVQVVLKALEKEPADRFRDADEMALALRQVAASLRASVDRVRCPRCGASTEAGRAFCGDCGMRLSIRSLSPNASPNTGMMTMPPPGERPLLGRDEVFERLIKAVRGASGTARVTYVLGELGIGKTRLLAELAINIEREGYVVIQSGPHESGAPVAYSAIRRAVAQLLNVSDERLVSLAEDDTLWRDRVARAGIRELVSPEGVPGHEGVSRAGAVSAALARAVSLASSRSSLGRVVLLFDDLMRCDGLSAEVLAAFSEHASSLPVFVVVSAQSALPLCLRWQGPMIELTGIAANLATDWVRANVVPPSATLGGALPLHLEQLRALRWEPTLEEREPPSLAEAVTRRLALLDLGGRRVLQALAALGERVPLGELREMVEADDLPGLEKLVEQGLLRLHAGDFVFAHPYLRDVVAASTPGETKKLLHARALDLASTHGKPLEVRAEHAFRAGDTLTAMMLLDRMGQDALRRGDAGVGVLAFRRGLEIARRELLETGDEALDQAIVSFSRLLGEALMWSGDATGAAGVLAEAITLAGPSSLEFARMTLVQGRVAERRERPKDAAHKLAAAAEIAQRLGNKGIQARALWALARVRKTEGDGLGAINALTLGLECLVESEPRSARRCLVEIDLAEMLTDLGDTEAASDHLERALDLARDGEWRALEAAALGVLASIDELRGEAQSALTRYREACVLAADAGDLQSRDRWGRAARALSA
ncbi:MAG: serine/threonine protein kinase [Myxococcaceae bacterium]|nr:serine/threonine protein kinase [Myxococcaceae bacterium]